MLLVAAVTWLPASARGLLTLLSDLSFPAFRLSGALLVVYSVWGAWSSKGKTFWRMIVYGVLLGIGLAIVLSLITCDF
ncbi:MAG: hypothetical protein NTY53_18940 [Kiritimatiellaeota bacterium]|nr:hypothetical protein [Kiritimatiellota bacterium]